MQKTHLRTYANHVRKALMTRRDALTTELSVMFAVIIESDDNKRLARESIYAVWHATGAYQCAKPTDRDWKSVGRVISAAFALWDFVGAEEIHQWSDGLKHGELVAAIADRITTYKLSTVNEVLTITEKVKSPKTMHKSDKAAPPGATVVSTEHMRVVVPPTVTADELMTVINTLMEYAGTLVQTGSVTERKAA
jgi:hypothetical protein